MKNEYVRFANANSNENCDVISKVCAISLEYKQYMCDLTSLYNSRNINFDKGKLEGIEEGIEIGIEKGKLEMAQKMLKDNIEIEFISKYTGLSIEQISKLQ